IEQSKLAYGSHVLIIGAGGAAKAIAAECALRKPALLTIVNRTLTRAQKIAQKINGFAYDFEGLKTAHNQHYDIIINTLPITTETDMLILKCIQPYLSKNLVMLNIDYATDNHLLLKHLKTVGCELISPKAMFQSQAIQQLNYWLSHPI
ncbi:MAG TPA: saccharopine dehydrogenase NADP-binding domain-containing protein, partial [Coxiellaceae bacterium]|nr:saccharopine dehydrogenase NADP-binding domain-containing protein [Coxiellaceae bacterium]